MLYFAVFIIFVSLFALIYGILALLNRDRMKMEKRVRELTGYKSDEEEKLSGNSFAERTLGPLYKKLGTYLLKATPGKKLSALNKRLEASGLNKSMSPARWLFIKYMSVLVFSFLLALLCFLAEPNILKAGAIGLLIAVSINTFFNFYLSKRIEGRKRKILRDLPYTLDLITVSVEAGLSFDGAMARVVSNISGELCDEFAKSLKEIRMGIERKTALKNMSERCGVRELTMLITSLIQADDLGVSLSRVLRIEAMNLREHRKQAAREKAMKAPVKMLFPLVIFIFPTIFIIILGPGVIKMISLFGGN